YNPSGTAIAAALSVNVDVSTAAAYIVGGVQVDSDTSVTVRASGDLDSDAQSDALAVGNDPGVGATIALSIASPEITAEIGGNVSAPLVRIQTGMAGDGVGTAGAHATSGAGAADLGVAGSLAMNLSMGTSRALLRSGASVAPVGSGSSLEVGVVNVAEMNATADAKTIGTTGIGGSIAVNLGFNDVVAKIDDNASIIGGHNVSVDAAHDIAMDTTAKAGAQGGVAPAGAVAFSYAGNETLAAVGAGSVIDLKGTMAIESDHVSTTAVTARGDTAGTDVTIGGAVGINVSNDSAHAVLSRDLETAGNVTIVSSAETDASVSVIAGANGTAVEADDTADDTMTEVLDFYDPGEGTDEEVDVPSVGSMLVEESDDADVALPDLGVAATIGANLVFTGNEAVIEDGVTVTVDGNLTVAANIDTDAATDSDSSTVDSATGIGAGVAVNYTDVDNSAIIGAATVTASELLVSATNISGEINDVSVVAEAGSGIDEVGVAGSIAVNAGSYTTEARIAGDAVVVASDAVISSESTMGLLASAGGLVTGGSGVGASIALNSIVHRTEASIGEAASADAGLTVVDVSGVLTIQAAGSQSLLTNVAGAVTSAPAGLAGSIALNAVVATTRAYTGSDARINQNGSLGADPSQSVRIRAEGTTSLLSRAGAAPGVDIAGVGAALDVGSIANETSAYADGIVSANGNVIIEAVSTENIDSIVTAAGVSDIAVIAGSGSLYLITPVTQGYIAGGATVTADNVIVSADDVSSVDVNAGSAGAAYGVSLGASVAAPVLSKTTQAFIGAGATVTTYGTNEVDAKSGEFKVTYESDTSDAGEIEAPDYLEIASYLGDIFDLELFGYDLDYLTGVEAFAEDPSISGQRVATPETVKVRGLAITALSRDDLEMSTSGKSAAIGATPGFSAGAGLLQNQTTAYIAGGAVINNDLTGAHGDQSVLVSAGSDSYYMGLAGMMSAAIVNAGPALQLAGVGNTTEAYIGSAANVKSNRNVEVTASAREHVLAVAGGLSAGGIGLAASIPVVSIDTHTYAYIDGIVEAEGNVVVRAKDITETHLYGGSFALGVGANVQTSLGVTVVNKDTQAFIGDGAVVNAKANHTDGVVAYNDEIDTAGDDPVFAQETIKGLSVEAYSVEQVTNLIGSAGLNAGISISGTATAEVVTAVTRAYIADADVNLDATGANAAQTVNVSAVNDVWVFGVSLGLGASAGVNTAIGADFGFLQNDTLGYIGAGAHVNARRDVNVNAFAIKNIDSFVGGLTGSYGLGLRGSFSLHAIGKRVALSGDSVPDSDVQDAIDTVFSAIDGALGPIRESLDTQVATLSDTVVDLLNGYAEGVGNSTAAANAVTDSAPKSSVADALAHNDSTGGTAASIEGGMVTAGRDVNLSAEENISAILDTSYTFAIPFSSSLSFTLDTGLLANYSTARSFIAGGAAVTAARDIVLDAFQGGDTAVSGTFALNLGGMESAAYLDNANVNATRNLDITARKESLAAFSALMPGWSGLNYKVSLNQAENVTNAHIANGSIVDVGAAVTLLAEDNATIDVKAVSAAISFTEGGLGFGASVGVNNTANTTSAFVDDSVITSATSLEVNAKSTPIIKAIVAGVQGADSFALGASFAMNTMNNTVDAHISGTSDVTIPGAVTVHALGTPTIQALAGGVGGSLSSSVGATAAINNISDTIKAYIDAATITSTGAGILVKAESNAVLETISAGGAGAGTFAMGGSVSLNTIGTTVDAHISGGADVTAAGSVIVSASDSPEIRSLAGAVQGAGTVAIGAAFATNTISSTTLAYIEGASVESTGETVQVIADSDPEIRALSAGISGSGTVAVTGAVSLNDIGTIVKAYAGDGASIAGNNGIDITATDGAFIWSLSGQASGSGGVSVGGAASYNKIHSSVEAYAYGATLAASGGSIRIRANESSSIETIAASGAGGAYVGLAGSVAINIMDNTVVAYISTSTATAHDNILVQAVSDNEIKTYGGSAGGAIVGIAGSVSINTIHNTTEAFIDKSTVAAYGDGGYSVIKDWNPSSGTETTESIKGLAVIADADESIESFSGSIAGGIVGIGGNVTVNEVGDVTESYISDSSINSASDYGTAVKVKAHQNTDIETFGGVLAGGIVGIGGIYSSTKVINQTTARISDASTEVFAGADVEVGALSREKVEAKSFGGGGGVVGLAGSVAVVEVDTLT
ncbi:MAG: hypothetical protein GF344_13800, partial [Chitinivibrionales bacterium]|nr:hypothetical protein [Chitinivibrionales bacterium]